MIKLTKVLICFYIRVSTNYEIDFSQTIQGNKTLIYLCGEHKFILLSILFCIFHLDADWSKNCFCWIFLQKKPDWAPVPLQLCQCLMAPSSGRPEGAVTFFFVAAVPPVETVAPAADATVDVGIVKGSSIPNTEILRAGFLNSWTRRDNLRWCKNGVFSLTSVQYGFKDSPLELRSFVSTFCFLGI